MNKAIKSTEILINTYLRSYFRFDSYATHDRNKMEIMISFTKLVLHSTYKTFVITIIYTIIHPYVLVNCNQIIKLSDIHINSTLF